ncbi:MAG TPA: hypothetical protein DHV88_08985 [Roseburia sp.]|nr:hypothetical protein [Roseburia sp.]
MVYLYKIQQKSHGKYSKFSMGFFYMTFFYLVFFYLVFFYLAFFYLAFFSNFFMIFNSRSA